MGSESIQDRVTRHYGSLSPQLKLAAQFVTRHPEQVATRSLRWIANESDLPPPTFSRLARAIECQDYEGLREICRNQLRRRQSLLADKALSLIERPGADDMIGEETLLVSHSAAVISNIQSLLETISTQQLDAAADELAKARRVYLIGTLSAYAFIDYTSYIAAMAFPDWIVVGRGGASMTAGLAGIGDRDAALVLSSHPYGLRSVRAAELAHERGAHVIAITDLSHSPLAEFASSLFLVSTDSPQFFPSHVAALVLLEALMGMVVQRTGKPALARIAAVEKQNHMLGEYWQD